MISWMRGRLTYANVLVTALAFLVLAGTSVAQDAVSSAATLITGKDVKNHSLTKKDFKGSVRGPQGIQGPQGQQGIQGLKGDKGDTGAAGATSVKVRTASKAISGTFDTIDVFCEEGERAVGGGGEAYPGAARLISSRPGVKTLRFSGLSFYYEAADPTTGQTPDAWRATGDRGSSPSGSISAYVICAAP